MTVGVANRHSRLFEIALVLVRLDHVAVRIVHASYKQDVTAEKLRIANSVVWFGVP